MPRKIHMGLTHLFAGLLVVQFFLAGLGAFTTIHNKQFKDSNFDAHAALGSLLVLVALLIMLVALGGRWSRRATQTSGLLFGLMIVQMLLAGFGADDAPVLGGLHVLNALVIVGVTYALVRESRAPAAELAPA
ncbi:MAG TPA: DUF6220 domain-containing protein [Gaiellales bacterium]|jgi:hypothetical protein